MAKRSEAKKRHDEHDTFKTKLARMEGELIVILIVLGVILTKVLA